jgi:hypothetical protein
MVSAAFTLTIVLHREAMSIKVGVRTEDGPKRAAHNKKYVGIRKEQDICASTQILRMLQPRSKPTHRPNIRPMHTGNLACSSTAVHTGWGCV